MRKQILSLCCSALMVGVPQLAEACACGCGVFDVQTGSMMPNGTGGTVWLEYDSMNQNINWHNAGVARADENEDKVIRTHMITVGGQYMFNHEWGVTATLPYWDRYFKTTDEDSGDLAGFTHSDFGDLRVSAIYTGFSSDMSTGVTFGLKLPTGDYSYAGFDRDTAIGTGSTDLVLGAYHMGRLTKSNEWGYFVNAQADVPVLITSGYRPGVEYDAAGGAYYDNWYIGDFKIAPIAQVIASYRLSDRGPLADNANSGYRRLLVAPGVEVSRGTWRLFADVAFPVYQDMTGDQLISPALFKMTLSHDF